MNDCYELLLIKEEMWARMLMEVLKDNDIPCTSLPVRGAAFAMKTGLQDEMKIYVPVGKMAEAQVLAQELFSDEEVEE